jgi:hypothetical protein
METIKDNVINMSDYRKHFECHLCNTRIYYKEKDSVFDLLKNHSRKCSYYYSLPDDGKFAS